MKAVLDVKDSKVQFVMELEENPEKGIPMSNNCFIYFEEFRFFELSLKPNL